MAITGFIVNNGAPVCVATSQQAMEVLASAFPVYGGSAPSMCVLNSSVFSGVNTFTQDITCHDLTSNQAATFSHSLTLMMCDPALGIGGLNVFDPVAGAAFFLSP